ncbi:MAG: phage portal protein [Cyanobacteria bacterium P01_F01_bin.3]
MSQNEVTRNDGVLINTLTGIGTDKDATTHTQVGTAHRLGQGALDQLCQIWPLDVACTAFPDAATAKGWSIKWPEGTSDEVKEKFETYRNVIGTRTKDDDLRDQPIASDREIVRWAGFLANVYRGAAIVLNVDDGRSPQEPIDTNNIRTIREIEVLDSFQIYPDPTRVANPLKASHYHLQITPDWHPGLISMFQGRLSRQGSYYTYPIHRSRVIRIPGRPVPPQVMRYNNGWDRSLLETVWDQFAAWESVTKGVENLIRDYSLFVYRMSGFGDMILEEDEGAIRKRVEAMRLMSSVLGGLILDKEDEEVNFVARQFSGLNDLVASFRDMLIGALGIPHTILFGESPGGLGATGESEEKTWAKKVQAYQEGWPLAALTRMYQLMFLAKDGPTGGQALKGWSITFNPLLEQTEAEKIANRASQAQTDSTYLQSQVLSPVEIRQSRFGGTEYSFETTLDEKAYNKMQEQEADAPATGQTPPAGQDSTPATPPPDLEPEQMSLEDLQWMRGDSMRFDADLHQQAISEAKAKFQIWPSRYATAWRDRRYKELCQSKG